MFSTPLEVHTFQILRFGVADSKGLSIKFQLILFKSFMNFLKCSDIEMCLHLRFTSQWDVCSEVYT